ncbi:hypothetical protein EMIT07CA2_20595 [Brevibacillus sp. IT-7CA2]
MMVSIDYLRNEMTLSRMRVQLRLEKAPYATV